MAEILHWQNKKTPTFQYYLLVDFNKLLRKFLETEPDTRTFFDNLNFSSAFIILEQLRLKTTEILKHCKKETPFVYWLLLGQEVFRYIFNDTVIDIGSYWPFEGFVKLRYYILKAGTEKETYLAMQQRRHSSTSHTKFLFPSDI